MGGTLAGSARIGYGWHIPKFTFLAHGSAMTPLPYHQQIQQVLHAVRQALGMEVAFVSEFLQHRRWFHYVDAEAIFQPVAPGASDPLDDSYCQRVVDGRLPALITDAQQLTAARALPVTTALPIGAHLSVPIRFSDGEVFGTFCCFSRQADPALSQRDLAVVQVFAALTGQLLEAEVRQARQQQAARTQVQAVLDQQAFEVHYQPIVHIKEQRIVGHEALTRFTAPPLRAPDAWFRQALACGLHVELELAVMQRAMRALPQLAPGAYLSLNVSPDTLAQPAVTEWLRSQPLAQLLLEVTEHNPITDYDGLNQVLAPLRQAGLRLAVDDAGAGYASFRHILRLKPDIIKLDASLIQRIDSDRDSRALAAALIRFAEETGIRVVAEGVETSAQLQQLQAMQVNKVQGYLMGRPAPLPLQQSLFTDR